MGNVPLLHRGRAAARRAKGLASSWSPRSSRRLGTPVRGADWSPRRIVSSKYLEIEHLQLRQYPPRRLRSTASSRPATHGAANMGHLTGVSSGKPFVSTTYANRSIPQRPLAALRSISCAGGPGTVVQPLRVPAPDILQFRSAEEVYGGPFVDAPF